MKWEKIGTLTTKVGDTFNFNSGYRRDRNETIAFFLGPHRQIKCGCRAIWTDSPHEATLPEDASTCIHIKALYGNGTVVGGTLGGLLKPQQTTLGRIRLTPLGETMFEWRYAALALK